VDQQLSIAWAAGFLDGEGSITMYRNRNTFRIILRAVNTNRAPIDALLGIFKVGIVRVMSPKPRPGRKIAWRWYVGRPEHVEFVLKSILPFSVGHREAIANAIEFLEGKNIEVTKLKITQLNHNRFPGSKKAA